MLQLDGSFTGCSIACKLIMFDAAHLESAGWRLRRHRPHSLLVLPPLAWLPLPGIGERIALLLHRPMQLTSRRHFNTCHT